ncbi:MAG TPA: PDZ domain-containing protein [Chloroflexi bacterium]|nr:PDZ domain-containing protein [Chloroflexota bacterium]
MTEANVETLREAAVNLPVEAGVLVLETEPDSPAEQAGLRGGSQVVRVGNYRVPIGGDIITAIDGRPLTDSQDLTVYLETQTTVGDTVQLTVYREGQEQAVQVVLGRRS